jgi:hypothetical protein
MGSKLGIWAPAHDTFANAMRRSSFAVAEHRASLQNPPKSVEECLDTLLAQELPETVTFLRQRHASI